MPLQSQALRNMARTLLQRSPGLESALRGLHLTSQFRTVPPGELRRVSDKLSGSWMNDEIPAKQRSIVERELAEYRAGKPSRVFDAIVDILLHNIPALENRRLLEIGCSSGYYSEVLRCRRVAVTYRGCDFSAAFVHLAREKYPSIRFDVEDATSLSYDTNSFDIVVSGCCLLHISQYEMAIAEATRVSREYVVFHRTPVLHMTGPVFYTKMAYGVEMLEIHFNEQQLVRMFVAHGLNVIDINSHISMTESGQRDRLYHKTYLCRKLK